MKYLIILLILTPNLFGAAQDPKDDTLYKTGLALSRDFLREMLPVVKEVAASPAECVEASKEKLSGAARVNAISIIERALNAQEPPPSKPCMNQTIMIGLIAVTGLFSSLMTYWWLNGSAS